MTLTPLVYSYEYNSGNDLLSSVTYPDVTPGNPADNPSRSYLYENASFPKALTGIVDERGSRIASWGYDAQGSATFSVHGDPLSTIDRFSITYNGNGTSTVVDPLGASRTYSYVVQNGVFLLAGLDQPCQACGGSFTANTFDANNNPDLATDFEGNLTDHDYDANGLETQRIEAKNTPEQRTIETDWDVALRQPLERRTKDASGTLLLTTNWTYNARGQVLTRTEADPVTSRTRSSSTAYCEQADVDAPGSTCSILGLIKSTDGPRTDVSDITTFTYYPSTDESGCDTGGTCHRKGDLWKVTNALGHVSEMARYDRNGRVLESIDANGVHTTMTYHPRGWLLSRTVVDPGNGPDATISYEYDAAGQVTKTTQADGSWLGFDYDDAQRLTGIYNSLGERIDYTLDNAGNRTQEDTKAGGGTITRTLSRVYNDLGQLEQVLDAQSHATSFTYDNNGQQTSATDALSNTTQSQLDPLKRLKATIQTLGGVDLTTGFDYDPLDRLTQVTDAKGLSTGYTYDALGNLTQLQSPDTGTTTYTYDDAGNRLTQTDARGVTTSYSYDALNRLSTISYPDSSLNTAFFYDSSTPTQCDSTSNTMKLPSGWKRGTLPVGRLTRMTDASGETTWCYDYRGNVIRKAQKVVSDIRVVDQRSGADTRLVRSHYTLVNQLAGVMYSSGLIVEYGRDGLGRINTVTGSTSMMCPGLTGNCTPQHELPLVTSMNYAPFGPSTQMVTADGVTVDRQYDLDYRLGAIDSSGSGLDLDFGYDVVGNLDSLDEDSTTRHYVYDDLYRLTEAQDGSTNPLESFAYDAIGNRTSRTESSSTDAYAYGTTSHRLQSVAGVARSYDPAGNTTAIGTATALTYDQRNRLVLSLTANGRYDYLYNGRGERVAKAEGTSGAFFIYGAQGQLLGEYRSDGSQREVVWLDGMPIAVVDRISKSGSLSTTAYYIEADHLGTPRAVRNAAGTRLWHWPLSGGPFGDDAPNEDADGNGTDFVFNLRFPGQYFDAETGLHYNYFRDYEPGTGRYVESDPVGLLGGSSTFSYVSGSPLAWADVLGLLRWSMHQVQWSLTYQQGGFYYSYPGVKGPHRARPGDLGQTTINWNISQSCVCADGNFNLAEFSVDLYPIVYLRQRYANNEIYRWIHATELDHIRDMWTWQIGAEIQAELLEEGLKQSTFASKEECEEYANDVMSEFLTSSAGAAFRQGGRRWDDPGLHTFKP